MIHLEDPGPGGGATARRTLGENPAQRLNAVTRDARSRQLPTNEHHAALRESVTREYQCDRPSKSASPSGPGSSRDGPIVNNNDGAVDSARPYQGFRFAKTCG